VPFLKKYYEEFQEERTLTDQDIPEELSPDEYAKQRSAYIQAGKGTPPAGSREGSE